MAYWDFDVPQSPDSPRDSSASAIAVAGMLEMVSLIELNDPERVEFANAIDKMMSSLAANYATADDLMAEGFLKHGSYYVQGNLSKDDYMIWGDYFYLEALLRIEKDLPGYWY